MDALANSEHTLLWCALGLIAILALFAATKGLLIICWALAGAIVGSTVGYFCFQNANALLATYLPGLELGTGGTLAVSIGAGIVAYLLVRKVVQRLLSFLFNPEGPCKGWAGGVRGGVLSLIPSLIILVLVAGAIRIGGTLSEYRQLQGMTMASEEGTLALSSPEAPLLTRWRDKMESWPGARTMLGLFDPLSRPAERNLVGLLLLTQDPSLRPKLSRTPETRELVKSIPFVELERDESVQKLVQDEKWLALLRHPALIETVADAEIAEALAILDLPAIVSNALAPAEA